MWMVMLHVEPIIMASSSSFGKKCFDMRDFKYYTNQRDTYFSVTNAPILLSTTWTKYSWMCWLPGFFSHQGRRWQRQEMEWHGWITRRYFHSSLPWNSWYHLRGCSVSSWQSTRSFFIIIASKQIPISRVKWRISETICVFYGQFTVVLGALTS